MNTHVTEKAVRGEIRGELIGAGDRGLAWRGDKRGNSLE